MARVHERLYVRCPFGKAPSYLAYYLDQLARDGGSAGAVLRLEAPLADVGVPGNLSISRDVVAHFAPVDGDGFGTQETAVDWSPAPGGPFPKFVGVITIEADESYGTCALVLDGTYEPPLGMLGAAFDAAIGQRIANATARELLRSLRDRLEIDYLSSTKQVAK